MEKILILSFILITSKLINYSFAEHVCYKDTSNCSEKSNVRYLFYDINPPEGFNLRRDVYIRFAVLTYKLQMSKNPMLNNFRLVLPPWSHLLHWKYSEEPEHIPWGLYFDITSLQRFAPVIEMYQFFKEYHSRYQVIIDEVYTLQHFKDMFETGNFEDRMEISECQQNYQHFFFFYKNITSKNYKCLSYHGPATKLTHLFLNTSAQTILVEHAEVALHDIYGNRLYWEARRSMRFNTELKNIADTFRKKYLNSYDVQDNTLLPDNWRDEQPRRNARGGPYIAVHLRRKDFVRHRPNEAPPLTIIATQIAAALEKNKLTIVFVATDGSHKEFQELLMLLPSYEVIKYEPSEEVNQQFKSGGIAILDQMICSYARYFIGTQESTFSFRIQEEREIIGFPVDSTFNFFCNKDNCKKPSIWNIVY